MRSEKLLDAIGMIGDDLITEAKKKRISPRKILFTGVAACLLIVLMLPMMLGNNSWAPPPSDLPTPPSIPQGANSQAQISPSHLGLQNLVASPTFPSVVSYSKEQYQLWEEFQAKWEETYGLPDGYLRNLEGFFAKSARECLSGEGNQLYSPISIYLSLAMLAECSDGQSRQEILTLLGVDDLQQLRSQAQRIWMASYRADGKTNCVLSNSIWLDKSVIYNNDTVKTLAEQHYTCVMHGDLQSDQMSSQLRTWLNAMTGNVLSDSVKNLQIDSATAIALVSAIHFKAQWTVPFKTENTYPGIFHSSNGDKQVAYLFLSAATGESDYYWSNQFRAVCRPLTGGQSMWFILPEEGSTPQKILQNRQWLEMVMHRETWNNRKKIHLELSVPKFDISNKTDIIDSLKNMGVREIFDPQEANFNPLCFNKNIQVGEYHSATRVYIDEFGVSGAAFASPFIYFSSAEASMILDRPFIFVIASSDGVPLFVGIVEQP